MPWLVFYAQPWLLTLSIYFTLHLGESGGFLEAGGPRAGRKNPRERTARIMNNSCGDNLPPSGEEAHVG